MTIDAVPALKPFNKFKSAAISVYVLVAIIKKRLKVDLSLYTILQILSITLFEKMPILQAFSDFDYKSIIAADDNQLKLF